MNQSRRSISPVVATALLLVVAVLMVVFVDWLIPGSHHFGMQENESVPKDDLYTFEEMNRDISRHTACMEGCYGMQVIKEYDHGLNRDEFHHHVCSAYCWDIIVRNRSYMESLHDMETSLDRTPAKDLSTGMTVTGGNE